MNYIDALAHEIRGEVPDGALPQENTDDLFRVYAVLLLSKGAEVTRGDVHDAWVAWMTMRGKHHVSMVPFDELDVVTRDEDSIFMKAIRRVAARQRTIT
jgi:hypothetical protein